MTKQTNKYEIRKMQLSLDGVKENADGTLFVSGYANRTNTWSQKLSLRGKQFVERIVPGTFQKALAKGNDIMFLAEHKPDLVLASTRATGDNGKLTLREDENGLYMEATISPTSYGKDYFQLIKDGIIQSMSFGMQILKDDWKPMNDGTYQRSVSDIQLFEISAVKFPAYVTSTLSARSIDVLTINNEELKGMEKLSLKDKRLEIIGRGKEIHKNAKAEQRSTNVFENAELRDLETELLEIEAQIEAEKNEEQRAVVEAPVEKYDEGPTVEQRAVEAVMLGNTNAEEVRTLQTNGDGAYIIPTVISDYIVPLVESRAQLFERTTQIPKVNGVYEIPREKELTIDTATGLPPASPNTFGWVGKNEFANITPSDFTMDKIQLGQKRVGTAVELSDQAVHASGLPVVEHTGDILGRRLGGKLDFELLFGNGTTSLEGIISSTANPINKITTASQTAISFDELRDAQLSVPYELQEGAVWVMHPKTYSALVKIKDDAGGYMILRDKLTEVPTRKLFDCDILFDDNMQTIGAGNTPVLFGNFKAGYVTTVKKDLNLQHIWKDSMSRKNKKHLVMMDAYLDGKILEPKAFAKVTMPA